MGNGKFSKGLLKDFVRWIFLYVPSVSVSLVNSIEFWDTVGDQLTLIACMGDSSVWKFSPLLILICKVTSDKGKSSGSPVKSHPLLLSPSPPGVPHQGGQDNIGSPDTPRSPLLPCQGRLDHPIPDLPLPLLPMPTYPVASSAYPPSLSENVSSSQNNHSSSLWQGHSCSLCPAIPQNVVRQPLSSQGTAPQPPVGSPSSSSPATKGVTVSGPTPNISSSLLVLAPANTSSGDVAPPVGASAHSISGPCPDHLSPLVSHAPSSSSHGLGLRIGGSSPDTAQLLVSHGPPSSSHTNDTRREQAQDQNTEGRKEFFASPVVYNQQGANPRWEPFPYGHLRELCNVAKEFGRESSYFKSLLNATFSTNVVVPSDIKTVMSSLLSDAQYWIWERSWNRKLKELLEMYGADPQKAFLTLVHLMGEGNMEKLQDQTKSIPPEVLQDI